MRFITITLSVAVIALGAASARAATSSTANPATDIPPSPCHAYEQNPDGSWKEIACAEEGMKPPGPAKLSTRNEGKASH